MVPIPATIKINWEAHCFGLAQRCSPGTRSAIATYEVINGVSLFGRDGFVNVGGHGN